MIDKIIFFLRSCQIIREAPGYCLLIEAIKYRMISGRKVSREELVDHLKAQKNIIVPKLECETKRDPVEQWALESIRAAGYDEELDEFVDKAVNVIKSF